MGKKQHSKDRMFITSTEWANEWGGAKSRELNTPYKRLPFYCCSVSFTPFEDPVCTQQGHVFDILNIVPYIQKFGRNPVTGKSLEIKDLIQLKFHRNSDGEYHCPVLNKVFTEFTHIVAVKTSGNVFSYEAVRELNIKAKNWRELLTDEPFTREDLITIQDPNNMDAKLLTEFDHVKSNKQLEDEESLKAQKDPMHNLNVTADTARTLRELSHKGGASEELLLGGGGEKARRERAAALAMVEASKKESKVESKAPSLSVVDMASAALQGRSSAMAKADVPEKTMARVALHSLGERKVIEKNSKLVPSKYTSGKASCSFTSTTFTPVTKNEFEMVRVEKVPKKKGYVKIHTNLGELNVELHCDIAPRTCENFITHAQNGYYNGTIFHRSIRNFMIQGGDPTGTGLGGESIWGRAFKDELDSRLLHSGRGIVSMANSGPHSNGSQFFIMYKSARHLDYKHSVFGRVVGGIDVLSDMEKVPVDDSDRPLSEIKILRISVFVNPYTEMEEEEQEAERKLQELDPVAEAEKEKRGSWFSNPGGHTTALETHKSGVGKYLKPAQVAGEEAMPPPKRRKEVTEGVKFGNFDGW